MPYKIIWEDKGVILQYIGELTASINREGLNTLFGDYRIDGIKYIIADFSQVSSIQIVESDVDYPVAMSIGAANFLKGIKLALVAQNEDMNELHQLQILLMLFQYKGKSDLYT